MAALFCHPTRVCITIFMTRSHSILPLVLTAGRMHGASSPMRARRPGLHVEVPRILGSRASRARIFFNVVVAYLICANAGWEANTGTTDPRSAETKVVEMSVIIDFLVTL